jgi:S1-C subfamily serine protease
VLTRVAPGGPASKAGLKPGDRIVEFAGEPISNADALRGGVVSAVNPVPVVVERPGATEPVRVQVELSGKPVRLGLSWRLDDAEPNALIINRVVPGSPAAVAGLQVHDRIYSADDQESLTTESFLARVASTVGPLDLWVETNGRTRMVSIPLPGK